MEEQTVQTEQVGINSFTISFGDLSNLESLANEADEKLQKKGFAVEHLAEIKKIVKRVKSATKSTKI